MNKNIKYLLSLTAVIAAVSCAKEIVSGPNEKNILYIESWMQLYNQSNGTDIKPSGLGIYVLDETPGKGDITVTDNGYAMVEYTITDLEGNITSYTSEDTAKKLGNYEETSYYGPKVWLTLDATIQAGLQDAIVGMKTGGSKKVMIPSWLMSYATYASAEDYRNNETNYSHSIYEFTVKDFTDSIDVWQIDSIERYITKEYGSLEAFSNDTTGFYYKTLREPVSDKDMPTDTTVYINYVGKLLNGLIFDTNIERVAKDNGLYNPSSSYGPTSIKWGEKASEITMGSSSSSVISGFAMTLWRMKAMEKGVGIFYSPLGYSYSGSGSSIPGYSPLIFEIEFVAEPED